MDGLYNVNKMEEELLEEQKQYRQHIGMAHENLICNESFLVERASSVASVAELDNSPDEPNWEETRRVCDEFIRSITKKLADMPLSVRYLCKLVERLALVHVRFRKLIRVDRADWGQGRNYQKTNH